MDTQILNVVRFFFVQDLSLLFFMNATINFNNVKINPPFQRQFPFQQQNQTGKLFFNSPFQGAGGLKEQTSNFFINSPFQGVGGFENQSPFSGARGGVIKQ